ncbi:hypothetical protein Tco_0807417 [Tanacetum coccineum]
MEETKGAEAELGELIEFHVVNPRHVVAKDLNQKPFLYPMMSSDRMWGENASFSLEGGLMVSPVLLDEDASSSKRFLPAIARDSF